MYSENKQNQPELFDGFSSSPKPRRDRSKPVKKLNISASHELVLFSSILLLMAIIVSFAIGFERGKRLSGNISRKNRPSRQTEVEINKPVVSQDQGQIKEQILKYAIQLVAYTQKSYADNQMEKLTKYGHQPFMVQDKKFYLVYIGPYPDKKEANLILKKIRSRSLYHDAFITKIK